MLYLDRRRKKRVVRAERAALGAGLRSDDGAAPERVLLAFASQSGTAEGIALRSAAALQAAGVAVTLASLARLDAQQLRDHQRVLIVASSFGEGGPPDMARRFAQQLSQLGDAVLSHLHYGLLALGDRHYLCFCGFGHTLDQSLVAAGARAMFPMIEVDNGDAGALAAWRHKLGVLAGAGGDRIADLPVPEDDEAPFANWTLSARRLLNPDSIGTPLYDIELTPAHGELPSWQPGALVELLPRLHDAQSRADKPAPLAPRRYSIASMPREGRVRLLVRQARHASGLGIASGWLTAHALQGADIELRLLRNPGFELVEGDVPCIFIGNGSGYAGLRGHLGERIARGHRRNWLLFGERQRAHDAFFMDEVAQWRTQGLIERIDLAFSRDQPARIYVQDRLREAAEVLRHWIGDGAVLYVCGSLAGMAAGVDAVLEEVLGRAALDDLIAEGRYRRDVY
nr:sulfite reductase subunit alpha [Variovorax sp. PAMC26660]